MEVCPCENIGISLISSRTEMEGCPCDIIRRCKRRRRENFREKNQQRWNPVVTPVIGYRLPAGSRLSSRSEAEFDCSRIEAKMFPRMAGHGKEGLLLARMQRAFSELKSTGTKIPEGNSHMKAKDAKNHDGIMEAFKADVKVAENAGNSNFKEKEAENHGMWEDFKANAVGNSNMKEKQAAGNHVDVVNVGNQDNEESESRDPKSAGYLAYYLKKYPLPSWYSDVSDFAPGESYEDFLAREFEENLAREFEEENKSDSDSDSGSGSSSDEFTEMLMQSFEDKENGDNDVKKGEE